MRDNKKTGFVMYFDNCGCVEMLPMEQRGQLFTDLFGYAQAAMEGTTPLEYLQHCPGLQPPGQMAFLLIAETIRRDTEKWRQKRERYQEAAVKRWTEKQEKPEKTDDAAYLRRLIRQRERE